MRLKLNLQLSMAWENQVVKIDVAYCTMYIYPGTRIKGRISWYFAVVWFRRNPNSPASSNMHTLLSTKRKERLREKEGVELSCVRWRGEAEETDSKTTAKIYFFYTFVRTLMQEKSSPLQKVLHIYSSFLSFENNMYLVHEWMSKKLFISFFQTK